MKKSIAIVLVIALAIASVSAKGISFGKSTSGTTKKDALSVGIGLGTNSGLAVRYGMGKFDLQGDISAVIVDSNVALGIDCGAAYDFYDWKFNTGTLTPTQTISCLTGPMAVVKVGGSGVALDALWTVGAEYTFSKVPVTAFTKLGLGVGLDLGDSVNMGLASYFVIGALYNL